MVNSIFKKPSYIFLNSTLFTHDLVDSLPQPRRLFFEGVEEPIVYKPLTVFTESLVAIKQSICLILVIKYSKLLLRLLEPI